MCKIYLYYLFQRIFKKGSAGIPAFIFIFIFKFILFIFISEENVSIAYSLH